MLLCSFDKYCCQYVCLAEELEHGVAGGSHILQLCSSHLICHSYPWHSFTKHLLNWGPLGSEDNLLLLCKSKPSMYLTLDFLPDHIWVASCECPQVLPASASSLEEGTKKTSIGHSAAGQWQLPSSLWTPCSRSKWKLTCWWQFLTLPLA